MPFPNSTSEARETTENTPDRESARPSSSPVVGDEWQSRGSSEPSHVVETALAEALAKAAAAEQWSTVEALSGELRARREARARVVSLDVERAKRERKR